MTQRDTLPDSGLSTRPLLPTALVSPVPGPLSGLLVVETGEGIAVAFCGKLLADYGATVIKVEHPRDGDPLRRMAPFAGPDPDSAPSALHLFLNTNKLGVTLDLQTAAGKRILCELTRAADILTTFTDGEYIERTTELLTEARQDRQDLIELTLSWLGQTGPWRGFLCDEFLAQHLSGMAFSTAVRVDDLLTQPPLATPGHLAEMVGGLTAATAAVVAVFGRASDGRGEQIDVAIVEALASFLRQEVVTYTYGVGLMSRLKQAVSQFAGVFQQPAADGDVDILIRTEASWRALVDIIGNPDWALLETFATPPLRSLYWDALEPLLQGDLSLLTSQEVYVEGQRRGIAIAPVNTVAEAAAAAQFTERGFFISGDHPSAGEVRYPGPPFRVDGPIASPCPAPALGQDNAAVFGNWLGHSDADLTRLAETGAI